MPTNNVHPSFKPIWDSIQERGPYSPHVSVQIEADQHTHILKLGNDQGWSEVAQRQADGESIEESADSIAEELAEAVARCNDSRHEGHGRTHELPPFADIARSVMEQLTTTQYDREHAESRWKQMMFKKWGRRHMPAAVLVPKEGSMGHWELLIPDFKGDPFLYPLRDDSGLEDILPAPTPDRANKQLGYGYRATARESQDRKLRKLHRRGR
jgi:hypothetical protein